MSSNPKNTETGSVQRKTLRLGNALLERMLEHLSAISKKPGDLRTALESIAQAALDLFSADLCAVYAMNPVTRNFLDPPVSPVWKGSSLPGTEIRLDTPRPQGITNSVIAKGEPVVIPSLRRKRGMSNDFTKEQGICSVVAIPLITPTSGKVLAVIYIDFRQVQTWRRTRREFLGRFASQAAMALQSVWFLRRYRSIAKAGQRINQKVSGPAELIETLRLHLRDVIETESCFVLALRDKDSDNLTLYGKVDGKGFEPETRWQTSAGPFLSILGPGVEGQGKAKLEIRAEFLPSNLDSAAEPLGLRAPGSGLVASLIADGEVLGLLTLQHSDAGVYGEEDRNLFQLLASQVALACSNQKVFGDLERLQKVGEVLTQQLESNNILQEVTDRIQEVTGAELVVLYSYHQADEAFVVPPTFRGICSKTDLSKQSRVRTDDIASLGTRQKLPVFVPKSADLYRQLGGDPEQRQGNFEEREEIASVAVLPLWVAGECVGVLFVNFHREQTFPFRQQQLLAGLSRYAAIAIRNARAFGERASRPLKEQEILRKIDKKLIEASNLEEILEEILRLANQLLRADEASILLYDPKSRSLETRAAIGSQAKESREQKLLIHGGRGISVQAFKKKISILVPDVCAAKWKRRHVGVGGDTVSELDVPMIIGRAAIGVLNFESRKVAAFSESDQHFLELLAGQAVLAVRRAQDLEKVKRLAIERKALISLGNQLAQEERSREVYELIVARALEISSAQAGVLLLADPASGDLEVVAEQGAGEMEVPRRVPREGVIWKAAQEKKSFNVPDVRKKPWSDIFVPTVASTLSELVFPILEGNTVRGVLNIESPHGGFFTRADEQLLEALANVALVAMQNHERLEKAQAWSERLEAVHRLSQEVLSLDKRDELIRSVAETAAQLTKADFVDLDLYQDGTRTRVYQVERRGEEITSRWLDLGQEEAAALERGLMEWVARKREPFLSTGNVNLDPRYRGAQDIQSELIVPLLGDGHLLGVLNAESRRENAFDREDLQIFGLLASEAAVAIQNSQVLDQVQREKERFSSLFEAGRKLAGVAHLGEVQEAYREVIEIARQHCRCNKVVIRRLDPEKQALLVATTSGGIQPEPFGAIPIDKGLNGYVARERRPILVYDAEELPKNGIPVAWKSDENDRSFAIVPVMFGEEQYFGNLALSDPRPGQFEDNDLELLRGLARQLGLTLHRLEELDRRQRAERLAQEDWIMNLAGRQSLEVTHRLKNNLGWIPNRIDRFRRREKADSQPAGALQHLLTDVERDVERVLTQGDAIAESLRAGRGADRVTVAARQLLEDSLDTVRLSPNIDVLWQVDDYQARVHVIYRGIVDALANLMTNANEAMVSGGTLTLGSAARDSNIEIRVTDTGGGIPPDVKDTLFGLGKTTRGQGRAGGLGLASASRSVWADMGTIEVPQTGITGTTFLIRLPAAPDNR